MRQTFRIFKKDVRHLWVEITLVNLLTALYAIIGVLRATRHEDLQTAWGLSMFLLPLGWCFLISRVIHAEALPGLRQFWLTRPYDWKRLLAAKGLFVVAFINVPMLVADSLILVAFGFHLRALLLGLLCRQLLFSAVFLLPGGVLAAVTTGLVQLVLTVVGLAVAAVAFLALDFSSFAGLPWFGLMWFRDFSCVALCGTASFLIILFQYSWRKTVAARVLALVAVLIVSLLAVRTPWNTAFAIQSRLSQVRVLPNEVDISIDPARTSAIRAIYQKGDKVEVTLPIRIAGPEGRPTKIDAVSYQVLAADGSAVKFDSLANFQDSSKLTFVLPGPFYRSIKDEALQIKGTAYVTFFSAPEMTAVVPNDKAVAVPGAGLCRASVSSDDRTFFLLCDSPLQSDRRAVSAWARVRVRARVEGSRDRLAYTEHLSASNQLPQFVTYSPFPADFAFEPVTRQEYMASFQPPIWEPEKIGARLESFEVTSSQPVAHVWRSFSLVGSRLADSEVNMLR